MANLKRINVIVNGRQELGSVLSNLSPLVRGCDKVLLMTKSGSDEIKTELAKVLEKTLGLENGTVEDHVKFVEFNKRGYTNIDISKSESGKENPTIFCLKMPNSLYHTIPTALNDALRFVDDTSIARFIHFFTDDCKIISDSYHPEPYERFMDEFKEPFAMDSKTNQGNFAFKKYSPRFVFMSREHLEYPISFVQFEAKEHFIIDRDSMKYDFDEKVKRLYMTELLFRLHKAGIVKHPSFYPDPVLEQWVERDPNLPHSTDIAAIEAEYGEDDKYLRNELHVSMTVENAVDPIVKEMVAVIENRSKSI